MSNIIIINKDSAVFKDRYTKQLPRVPNFVIILGIYTETLKFKTKIIAVSSKFLIDKA